MIQEMRVIHMMSHILQKYPDLPEKHKNFYEALAGQGLCYDMDIPDILTLKQAKAIALEYLERLYKETGHDR